MTSYNNILALTEIRNAINANQCQYNFENSNIPIFKMDSDIAQKYERAKDFIVHEKIHNYETKKNARDLDCYKHMIINGSDIPISTNFVANEFINRLDEKRRIISAPIANLLDNINTVDESIIARNIILSYEEYKEKILTYLESNKFFKWSEREYMSSEYLLDTNSYNKYLMALFQNIMNTARQYILVKLKKNSPDYKGGDYMVSTNVFINKNNNDLKVSKQIICFNQTEETVTKQKFNFNVNQLYILLRTIKCTKDLLNVIISNEIGKATITQFYNKFNDNWGTYLIQKQKNKPLLPTTWTEYFLYPINSWNINNNIILPFSNYSRYMACWFETNKIENEYNKYLSDVLSNASPDHVEFYFFSGTSTYMPESLLIDTDYVQYETNRKID